MSEVMEAPAMPPVNIAAAMAKSGVRTDENTKVEIPDIKIDAAPTEQQVVATQTTETLKAETAPVKPDEPAKDAVQSVKAAEKPATPAPVIQQEIASWKEALKKHNPDHTEVLKELGYDDKMVAFYQKWKEGGNVKDYLEAVSVDFGKMSPEQLMKYQLQQKYPELSDDDQQELYRMKVIEQYKLDPDMFSESEIKRGKILLTADAKEIREQLIEHQKQHLLPPAPPPAVAGPSPVELEAEKRQKELTESLDRYKAEVQNDAYTKALVASKVMEVGEGPDAFKFSLTDPEEMVDLLTDPEKWAAKLFDSEGKADFRKQLLLAAVAADDKTFIKELGKHFKKLGAKEAIMPIENASGPAGVSVNTNPDNGDPVKILAKSGVITGG